MDVYTKHRRMINRRHGLYNTNALRTSPELQEEVAEIVDHLESDLDAIIEAACNASGVSRHALSGRSRKRPLPDIRHVVFYVASKRGHALEHTGMMVGGRDHTSVIYGRDKVEDMMDIDETIARLVDEVIGRLE